MMRRTVGLGVVVLLLSLLACTVNSQDSSQDFIDKRPTTSRQALFDPALDQQLKAYYQVIHCVSHEAYVVEDEVCISYTFSPDVTKAELDTLLTAYTYYVVQGPSHIGYSPYAAYEGYKSLNRYTLRFFMGNQILLYKSYSKTNNQFETFENTAIDVPCRQIDSKKYDVYLNQLKKSGTPSKNIRIMNALTPFVTFISIEHPGKELKENELAAYKALVENLVAEENQDQYGLAYVLEVRTKEYVILSSLSYFISRREWVEGDWMNMDYFSMQ